jgi:hypothetical protein
VTTKRQDTISHSTPNDMMLNTARMRDTIHMKNLQYTINEDSMLENAILTGVANEINNHKALTTVGNHSRHVS